MFERYAAALEKRASLYISNRSASLLFLASNKDKMDEIKHSRKINKIFLKEAL